MFAMIAHHEETIALTKSMQALFLKNVNVEVHISFSLIHLHLIKDILLSSLDVIHQKKKNKIPIHPMTMPLKRLVKKWNPKPC